MSSYFPNLCRVFTFSKSPMHRQKPRKLFIKNNKTATLKKIAAKNQVLEGGLEPPCKRMHMNLNHACLPISPLELNLYFADKIPLFTDCQVSIKHF